jgi:hypothetical protein
MGSVHVLGPSHFHTANLSAALPFGVSSYHRLAGLSLHAYPGLPNDSALVRDTVQHFLSGSSDTVFVWVVSDYRFGNYQDEHNESVPRVFNVSKELCTPVNDQVQVERTVEAIDAVVGLFDSHNADPRNPTKELRLLFWDLGFREEAHMLAMQKKKKNGAPKQNGVYTGQGRSSYDDMMSRYPSHAFDIRRFIKEQHLSTFHALSRDRAGHPNAIGLSVLLEVMQPWESDACDRGSRLRMHRLPLTATRLAKSAYHLFFRFVMSRVQKQVVLVRPRVQPGTKISTVRSSISRVRLRLGHVLLAWYQLHAFLLHPRFVSLREMKNIVFGWDDFADSVPPILTRS